MYENLTLTDIETLAKDVLIKAGTAPQNATHVARSMRLAERDGLRDAGLGALPEVIEHLRCGRVNGQAVPMVTTPSPATVHVDACGGFGCPAVAAGWDALHVATSAHGIAILTLSNSYPVTLPAHAAESCAMVGLAGICFATTPKGGHVAMALPSDNGPAQVIEEPATQGSALVAMVQAMVGGSLDIAALAGPVGGAIGTGHSLIVLQPGNHLCSATTPSQISLDRQATRARAKNCGVGVPATLLEKIINA